MNLNEERIAFTSSSTSWLGVDSTDCRVMLYWDSLSLAFTSIVTTRMLSGVDLFFTASLPSRFSFSPPAVDLKSRNSDNSDSECPLFMPLRTVIFCELSEFFISALWPKGVLTYSGSFQSGGYLKDMFSKVIFFQY